MRHHAVRVPATSANLGPGFDAFGFALDRHLVVATGPRDAQRERVRTLGDTTPELPTGDDNLVWRSLVAFCEHAGVAVPDVSLRARTRIPLERGLGSSSSAIVAGLVLGRALTGVETGDRELVSFACELEGHPDNVAPALLGGLVACTVDDDGELIVRRVNPGPTLVPRVLVPDGRQSTGAARAVLPDRLVRPDVVLQASRAGHVLGALLGVWPVASSAVGDRLHEPARLETMPTSAATLAELRRKGFHAWLSGAGPSVAVAAHPGDADDARVADVAARHGMELLAPAFDLAGAFVCPRGGCSLAGATDCVQCPHRRV